MYLIYCSFYMFTEKNLLRRYDCFYINMKYCIHFFFTNHDFFQVYLKIIDFYLIIWDFKKAMWRCVFLLEMNTFWLIKKAEFLNTQLCDIFFSYDMFSARPTVDIYLWYANVFTLLYCKSSWNIVVVFNIDDLKYSIVKRFLYYREIHKMCSQNWRV